MINSYTNRFFKFLCIFYQTTNATMSQTSEEEMVFYKLHFDENSISKKHQEKDIKIKGYSKEFLKHRIKLLLKRPLNNFIDLTADEQEEIFTIMHSYKSVSNTSRLQVVFVMLNFIFFVFIYESDSFFHIGKLDKITKGINNVLFNLTVLHTTSSILNDHIIQVIMTFYKIENLGDIAEEKFQSRLKEEINKKKVTMNNQTISDSEITKYYNEEYLMEIFQHNPKLKDLIYKDYKNMEKYVIAEDTQENNYKVIDFLYKRWSSIEKIREALRIMFFVFAFMAFKKQRYPSLLNIFRNNVVFLLPIICHLWLFTYYELKPQVLVLDICKILMHSTIFNVYWFIQYNRYEAKIHQFSIFLQNNNCIFDEENKSMAYILNSANKESPEEINSSVNTGLLKLITM